MCPTTYRLLHPIQSRIKCHLKFLIIATDLSTVANFFWEILCFFCCLSELHPLVLFHLAFQQGSWTHPEPWKLTPVLYSHFLLSRNHTLNHRSGIHKRTQRTVCKSEVYLTWERSVFNPPSSFTFHSGYSPMGTMVSYFPYLLSQHFLYTAVILYLVQSEQILSCSHTLKYSHWLLIVAVFTLQSESGDNL